MSLCLKPEMWQEVEKFKGAEYFRKALYIKKPTRFYSGMVLHLAPSMHLTSSDLLSCHRRRKQQCFIHTTLCCHHIDVFLHVGQQVPFWSDLTRAPSSTSSVSYMACGQVKTSYGFPSVAVFLQLFHEEQICGLD
ncbi:hypothetical protein XENORESO_011837 [Xenotaenia resolanae]|uniref:Uncharacterized protein n=1 Tax=Xenotaenia resolanae TaxID=208358 RepID=A0ABV0VUE5_9TELE